MSLRKLMTLAGLVLALVALVPASAAAKAGGTDRPYLGDSSLTVSLNVRTGEASLDGTGVATHLGAYTFHAEAIADPGGFSGTMTIVAANGDELTATFTATADGPPTQPHTTTGVFTITGGTGRFADASGTVTAIVQVTPVSFDGVTLIAHGEVPWGDLSGTISY